jgi:hypothetical protein
MPTPIRFERTTDMDLVRSIITAPSIWPHVSDDGSGAPEDYRPVDHPAILYVLAWDRNELLGLFMFAPENSITLDVHTCLLPAAVFPPPDAQDAPSRSSAAARGVIQWIWANTPCRRIVTRVPAPNRLALRFARNAGMMEYGRNERSWLKGGKVYDQILLGISKPEVV